jgi:hypothetical protein
MTTRLTIGGREPAFWIGLIATLILGAIQTIAGEGLIAEATAGQITDGVNALVQLALLFAPLITGLLIRPSVTSASQPSLPLGTPVLIKGTGDVPPPDAVVAPVENVVPTPTAAGADLPAAPPLG